MKDLSRILLTTVAALSITTTAQADTYNLTYDGDNITFTQTDDTEYEHTDECWIDCGDKFNYNGVLYETKVEAEAVFTEMMTVIEAHTTIPPITISKYDIMKTFPSDITIQQRLYYDFQDYIVEETGYTSHDFFQISHGLQANSRSQGNAELRFAQSQSGTRDNDVYIKDTYYGGSTYDVFYADVKARLETNIDGFKFQVNDSLPENNMRIKLNEIAGTETGFETTATDWIYGSDTSEIIVNLATTAFTEGFSTGFESGFREGYSHGYKDGFIDGFKLGYEVGVNE